MEKHEEYKKMADEASRVVAMLEEVSKKIGCVPSPSIVLSGLSAVKQNYPYGGGGWVSKSGSIIENEYVYDGKKIIGIHELGGNFIDADVFSVFQNVMDRCSILLERHTCGGHIPLTDPAFEIIRHLNNSWWGKKKNNSYPNSTAIEIMDKFPCK